MNDDLEKVKAKLNEVRERDRAIDRKCEQLEELKAQSTCIRSPDYASDRVQTSPTGDSLPRIIADIVDLQDEINADIDRFVDFKDGLRKIIDTLPLEEASVLYLKYFAYETIPQIAEEVHYHPRSVKRIHKRALQRLKHKI